MTKAPTAAPKNIPFTPSPLDHAQTETRCDVCKSWTANPSRCAECTAAGLTPADWLTVQERE